MSIETINKMMCICCDSECGYDTCLGCRRPTHCSYCCKCDCLPDGWCKGQDCKGWEDIEDEKLREHYRFLNSPEGIQQQNEQYAKIMKEIKEDKRKAKERMKKKNVKIAKKIEEEKKGWFLKI